LFGDLDKKVEEPKREAGQSKLFQNKGSSNPFTGSTLFSAGANNTIFSSQDKGALFSSKNETVNNPFTSSQSSSIFGSQNQSSSSIFGSQAAASSSLFGTTPLFNFQTLNKPVSGAGEDNEDNEEEGDNEPIGSDSPNAYNPVEDKKNKSIYTKKYLKQMENIYVFHKGEEKKYLSKGNGFLSIEYTNVGKKAGLIVYRNTMGNKIIEGILSPSVGKFSKYIKNFKHVACVSYITKAKDKFEVNSCKIPVN
jgi:hypothetical protein